jgi:SAM-dependent methyltransferase
VIDRARSFGRVADSYELGRPSWPAEAVELVRRESGLASGATVLDLGAGTGKLTRLLVPSFARVLAVEPLDEMRALIPPGAETLAGTAERIPLPEAAVAAVFCGECFHWFDWPRAIPEIERVLEPGGVLALMWNRPTNGVNSVEWPPGVAEALDRAGEHGSRYELMDWRETLVGSPFEELRFVRVPNEGEVSRERLVAWITSWSNVASLPEEERHTLVDEIAGYLTEPSYRAVIETHLYWARRAA